MKRLLAIVLLAAAACGGSKKDDTANAALLAPVELELGAELKLIDVGKNETVTVTPQGGIVVEGKTIAMVTKDGKIIVAGSNHTFTLRGDGSITAPDGIPIEVKLTPEGVIQSGDKSISLDPSGHLLGANPDAPQMKIEGATTTGLKRTALFVLIALTTPKPKS